jgi:hypothetical protein
MDCQYSEKEVALIKHFVPFLMESDAYKDFVPYPLYRIMVEHAFLANQKEDFYITSLRECLRSLITCKIYRCTPEWDALIDDRVLED